MYCIPFCSELNFLSIGIQILLETHHISKDWQKEKKVKKLRIFASKILRNEKFFMPLKPQNRIPWP